MTNDPDFNHTANVYEQDDIVDMYIHFHYGESRELGVENYPAACAREAMRYFHNVQQQHNMSTSMKRRALDVGCACGRSAFELSLRFDLVDAIDLSPRLLKVPLALQQGDRTLQYRIRDEGDLYSTHSVHLSDQEFVSTAENVRFTQADACNLSSDQFKGYDLVLAVNLVDRLYDPAKFLQDMKRRVNDNGLLVLTSPYTWLEEFTPKHKWLGGCVLNSECGTQKKRNPQSSLDGIKEILSPEFVLVEQPTDIEFVIRRTAREYEHSFAQFSAWRKISM